MSETNAKMLQTLIIVFSVVASEAICMKFNIFIHKFSAVSIPCLRGTKKVYESISKYVRQVQQICSACTRSEAHKSGF